MSGSYPGLPVWKTLFGVQLHDSLVGALGALSSVMSLVDVWPAEDGSARAETAYAPLVMQPPLFLAADINEHCAQFGRSAFEASPCVPCASGLAQHE